VAWADLDPELVKELHELGKISEGARQAIDFVDHYDVDLTAAEIAQQRLQRRPVQGGAGEAAIVIAGPNQPPALGSLTLVSAPRIPRSASTADACRGSLVDQIGMSCRFDR
jgi:hypothetical protein